MTLSEQRASGRLRLAALEFARLSAPCWPCDLELPPLGPSSPPVSRGDVGLFAKCLDSRRSNNSSTNGGFSSCVDITIRTAQNLNISLKTVIETSQLGNKVDVHVSRQWHIARVSRKHFLIFFAFCMSADVVYGVT